MRAKPYTPTPWTSLGLRDDSFFFGHHDRAWVGCAEHSDDAEFIVTAVNSHADMLEACKAFVDASRDYKTYEGFSHRCEEIRPLFIAAIAKATGTALLLLLLLPSLASAQEVRFVYPAFVTAQVLDLHSTHQALKAGAMEINPLMKHPAARYPIKTLMSAAILASAEKLRKDGKGKRAFWMTVAITAGTAAISYSNYRQARNLRRTR